MVYVALCRPGRHEWTLLGITLAVGPIVEIACIRVGGLHRYHLGWLGGVPLSIALWWGLAVLICHELVAYASRGVSGHPRVR